MENKELSLDELEQVAGGTSARLPDGLAKRLIDRVKAPDLEDSRLLSVMSNIMLASVATTETVSLVAKIKKELQEKLGLDCSDDEIIEYIEHHKGLA